MTDDPSIEAMLGRLEQRAVAVEATGSTLRMSQRERLAEAGDIRLAIAAVRLVYAENKALRAEADDLREQLCGCEGALAQHDTEDI